MQILTEDFVIQPADVHSAIARHMLADGYPIVLDMKNSQGAYIVDAKSGRTYFDFFTFFASNPFGMNHPKMRSDEEFKDWATLLFEQAVLAEGGQLEDPASFVQLVNRLMFKAG